MVDSNSPLLKRVMKADVQLAAVTSECWTHQLIVACEKVPGLEDAVLHVKGCIAVDWSSCMDTYVTHYNTHLHDLGDGDPRDANVEHRKCVTYRKWFDDPGRTGMCAYLGLPNLSRHRKRNMARFRLSSHRLAVETGRFINKAYNDRVCVCCVGAQVEDEYHVVFECCRFNEVREQYGTLFDGFDHEFQGDEEDMQLFFQQNPLRVARFISDCMDVYDNVYVRGRAALQADGQWNPPCKKNI
jgi:hypothetical protein